MIIAIDIDLTILDAKGELIEGAKENINKLKADGHFIIIWTSRTDERLDEAILFLKENEIQYDVVNENKPGIINDPRKVIADIYIDDKQINGLPQWDEIYIILTETIRSAMNKTKLIARSSDGAATINRETEGKTILEFYPVVFNQRSKLIREYGETFYEVIAPGALDNVLADPGLNVLATVDHNRAKMLGRNKSDTLKLSTDAKGLKATIEMPDTTLGRDMSVMIERGDYFECSFIYTIAENGVQYDRSGQTPIRTVTNIADLYDVSIVIDGAFANTEIMKRSAEMLPDEETATRLHDEAIARWIEIEHDILQKELEIINLKKIINP